MATDLRHWFEQQAVTTTAEGTPSPPDMLLDPPAAAPSWPTGQRLKNALWIVAALAAAASAGFFTRGQPEPAVTAQPAAAANAMTPVAVAPVAPLPASAATEQPAIPDETALPLGVVPAAPTTNTKPAPAPATARAAPRAKALPTTAAREPALAAPAAVVSTGTVQLAVSPWGTVEVDGATVGTAPPLTRLSLPEGTHTITVRNDDFPPFTTTVQVQADKPVILRHRFAP
jgi:serine/threonine-protein kinase